MRDRLGFGPERLGWPEAVAPWLDAPDLLLAQVCGPMAAARLDRLTVLGAFDFGGPRPGTYVSQVVMRSDDARSPAPGMAAAVNGFDSQSGWGALHDAGLAPDSGRIVVTGAHAASMEAVAQGEADLAAIDAVTWRLAPHPRLAVRLTTPACPAPPLVTAMPEHADALRDALTCAVAALPVPLRRASGLRAFVPKDAADYRGMALPPPP